jgi:TP901 family phage tail tape measure protein
MTMQDTVSYQERIQVVVDERALQSSITAAEREYQKLIANFNRQKQLQLQVTAKDDASNSLRRLQSLSRQTVSRPTQLRITAQDNATATLTKVQSQAQQLGRTPITMRVNVQSNAVQAMQNLRSTVSRGTSNLMLPVRAAGNAVNNIAPEVAGMAGPGVGAALVGGGAAAGVLAVGAALGVSTNQAMGFNRQIVETQNNTTMTSAEVQTLSRNVLDLSNKFGLSKEPLTTAARQIQDLTQNADAMNGIMQVAAETAASTGADVGQVGQVLANTLHQYRLDTGSVEQVSLNAAHAMGVLHLASAEGNMTMQQFSDSSGRAIALAGQLGVPLEQVTAGLAALTRNGFDAAQSQTQLVNIFTRVIRPAADAEKQIKALSHSSGVDLVSAYSATGLQTLGLTGIFARTTEAYQKMGMSQSEATQETLNLMNAQRGGIGAALLMGKGASDFSQILSDLTNTQLTDTYVNQAWARSVEQPSTQFDILGQRLNTAEIELGDRMIPAVMHMFDAFNVLGPKIGDVIGSLGNILGPILGVSDPMNAFDIIVQDLGAGLTNAKTWLDEFGADIQQNGSFDLLHEGFDKVGSALGPVVDLINPFRQGISDANDPTQALSGSAGDAATAFHNLATGFRDATTEIMPLVDAIKHIEAFLNGVGKSGVATRDAIDNAYAHGDQVNAALRNTAGGAFSGLGSAANAAVTGAGQAVAGAMSTRSAIGPPSPTAAELGMGGENAMTPEQTQAAIRAAYEQGKAVTTGMQQGIGNGAPDVYDESKMLAQNTIKTAQDELDSHSPSGRFQQEGVNIVQGLALGIRGEATASLPGAIQDMVQQIRDNFSQSMSTSTSSGVGGDVNNWLQQAMQATGVGGDAWMQGLGVIAGHESGGDPNAVNKTPVGNGEHATGLMQTIPSTFRAYSMPGHTDINNPVDNAIASIRYIQSRYGDISKVPGVASINAGGGYLPYAAGGIVGEPSLMVSMRTGRAWGTIAENAPEVVVPTRLGAAAAGGGGSMGDFAPQFHIYQSPGEDGADLADRIHETLRNAMPTYLKRYGEHLQASLSNMPSGSFS